MCSSDGSGGGEGGGGDSPPDNNQIGGMKPPPPCDLPAGVVLLETQVSGHPFDLQKNRIGMLSGSNGRILKPIIKPILGEREIAFYENLRISGHPTDMELLRYTPTYYGTKQIRVSDRNVKFLELEDITDGMAEPCVMDLKIGRRTWDPLAGPEKRASEDLKYAATKEAYGFSITGFQVYRVPSSTVRKYHKSYGKKLNEHTLVEALEMFLNATPNRAPCRDLLVRLLSILWKILALFRKQRRYHIFASSLLIAYDAKRLRHYTRRQLSNSFAETLLRVPISRGRSFTGAARSLDSLNHIGRTSPAPAIPSPLASPSKPSRFAFSKPDSPRLNRKPLSGSGSLLSVPVCESARPDSPTRSPRLSRTIDKLLRLKRSISLQNCQVPPEKPGPDFGKESALSYSTMGLMKPPKRVPDVTVHKLCRTHSYSNNFDADIIQMKEDYAALLSELSSTCEEKQNWVRVYMIDFAHIFPAEDGELDRNYLEGIENFIKLLEKFLS